MLSELFSIFNHRSVTYWDVAIVALLSCRHP